MKQRIAVILSSTLVLGLVSWGCANKQKQAGEAEKPALEAERGEHMRDAHGAGEGEESERQLTLDQVYDEVRKGTHLVLAYNKEANSFTGTVENVSDRTLDRVRVEVHLSNGTELGPSTQVDLQPGEKRLVLLEAKSDDFSTWSTHAEVGSGEHGHSHGEGEHSHEGEHGHSHGEGEEHSHEGEDVHSHDGEGAHEHN